MTDPENVLLENLPMIERMIAAICRQRGMSVDETEEFSAVVKLRIMENDYAILRRFRERSSLRTYLASVVVGILCDYRNHEYGKWHASAEARRLGDVATHLERLLYVKRWNLEEAIPEVERRFPEISRTKCEEIASRLRPRFPRRFVDIEEVELAQEDSSVLAFEEAKKARELSALVCDFLDTVPAEDRRVLRLVFESNRTVSSIARDLDTDMQPLYRRHRKLLDGLRSMLEAQGICAADVEGLVANAAILDFHLSDDERPRKTMEQGQS